jgi:hypothetical protein
VSTEVVAGLTLKPVNEGGTPQAEPFHALPAGHTQALPFQVWPPVQMLAQAEPFHEVPAAHDAVSAAVAAVSVP